tara:strand:+ start:755 stop:1018 length:264 start_codon:yes stop_codon:yes gene_type:complete
MNFSEIDRRSPRGQAYAQAKAMPGHKLTYKGEEGFRTVRFNKGAEEITLFGNVITPAMPGHWYEAAITDVTDANPDSGIGFRVMENT